MGSGSRRVDRGAGECLSTLPPVGRPSTTTSNLPLSSSLLPLAVSFTSIEFTSEVSLSTSRLLKEEADSASLLPGPLRTPALARMLLTWYFSCEESKIHVRLRNRITPWQTRKH